MGNRLVIKHHRGDWRADELDDKWFPCDCDAYEHTSAGRCMCGHYRDDHMENLPVWNTDNSRYEYPCSGGYFRNTKPEYPLIKEK